MNTEQGKEPKYKVGDKVRVVGKTTKHCFGIGSIVEISKVDESGTKYQCYDGHEYWYILESDLSPIEEQTKPLFIETDKHKMDFEIVGHQEGKEEVIYLKRYKEEQTNLVAEGSNTDEAPKATLSSGSSNSVEQMQKIIDMLFELSWTVGKKNEAVSWSRFDEAIELRSKQREIELLVNPLYQEWVNKNNKESEFDKLDPKDKEIMRLREIIKKHNIEQEAQERGASKADSSTVRLDNNSEKTMTSKDHSGLKEGEGKQSVNNELLKALEWAVSELDYIVEKNQDVSIETQLPFAKEAIQKAISAKSEPKEQVSNSDQELFNYLHNELGCLPLESQLADIEQIVLKENYALEQQLREAKEMYSKAAEMFKKSMGQLNQENDDLLKVNSERNKENIALRQENERLRNLLAEAEQHPNGFHYNAENSPTKKLAELNKNKGDKNV